MCVCACVCVRMSVWLARRGICPGKGARARSGANAESISSLSTRLQDGKNGESLGRRTSREEGDSMVGRVGRGVGWWLTV